MRLSLTWGCLVLCMPFLSCERQSPSPEAAPSTLRGTVKEPKEECEDLMNVVLPFAQEMLSKHREFYPFGGAVSSTGEITHVGGWADAEHPPSAELIKVLEDGFRGGAASGKYRATALVVDIRTVPPGKFAKQDAIDVRLDHKGGYSVHVIFPYSFTESGVLQLEQPFGEG